MELNGHQRGRRKDLAGYQNGELSSEDDYDPWTAWAYKPHTITLLLIGACFLVWASGALDPERRSETDLVSCYYCETWCMGYDCCVPCLLLVTSSFYCTYSAASCNLAPCSWNGCYLSCRVNISAFPET